MTSLEAVDGGPDRDPIVGSNIEVIHPKIVLRDFPAPPEGRDWGAWGQPLASEMNLRISGVDCPKLQAGASRSNRSAAKRFVDIASALFGVILLAPLLLLVAIMIRVESPGPALFRQQRTGRHGRPFVIYKFRTMRVQEDGAVVVQASRGDSRITRIGSFLRRSCIDELPQLINVIKGDMSLVGPRPHAVAHDKCYSALIEEYPLRFLVRPGLSGHAQVSGYRGSTPRVESMAKRVEHDLEYIREWSLGADFRILAKTFALGPFDPAAY